MGTRGTDRPLSLRRPRTVLGIALVLIVVLGFIGRNVEDRLNPTSLDVPGTASDKATKLLKQYFGDSAPFAILLQGPRRHRRTGPGAGPRAAGERTANRR